MLLWSDNTLIWNGSVPGKRDGQYIFLEWEVPLL